MRFRIALSLLIMSLAIDTLLAQDVVLSPGTPAEVGMEESVLHAGVEMFEAAVEKDEVRSVVLFVARKGKVILHEAIGWKDKEKAVPIEKDAMFRMASNTKPVVATGISILVEDEKLRFNDNVRKHIETFDNYRAGFINIHHLLTHTGGFRISPIFLRPLMERSPEHSDAPNLQLEVERFGEVGADELPGKTYSYSKPGYYTLGALIEIASGKPLEVFLKERIYNPLGMVDSYHHEATEKLDGKLDRMSVVYYRREGEWIEGWKPGSPPQYPFVRASGGMISTARDYAIFCQMFLNGGIYSGQRILREETVELMTSPLTAPIYAPEERQRRGSFYGYGRSVSDDGVFSHSGSDGAAAWVDPDNELIVLVFTQSPGEGGSGSRFLQIVRTSIIDH